MTLPDFVDEGIRQFWGVTLCWWCALLAFARVNFGLFLCFEALLSLLGNCLSFVCLKVAVGHSLARVRNQLVESRFLIWETTKTGVLPSWASYGTTFGPVGPGSCFLTIGIVPCKFNST